MNPLYIYKQGICCTNEIFKDMRSIERSDKRQWISRKFMIAIKEWSVDRSFKAEIDKTDTRVLANEIWFALFPLSQQLAAAFLSLRGTSRKTKLIEIHENFIRNSEASVKPGVVPHIKQFLLVFFFPCPHACGKRHSYRSLDIFHTMVIRKFVRGYYER